MNRVRNALTAVLLLGSLPLLGACGGPKDDPILALSAQEALELGKDWLEKKKFYKARQHLTHAFEVSPNSAAGREALLLAADTFYRQGGETNYIQAEAKYRDFLNRFPTSDRAPYVQFQIGNSLAERIKKPDRDQSVTEQAEKAYQEVLALYPTSEYAAQAREQIQVVRNRLAEHELAVGRFYQRYGLAISAAQRYEGLLETYPDYGDKESVYYYLTLAYSKSQQPLKALQTLEKLQREYPESPYLKDIPAIEVPEETEVEAAGEPGTPAPEEGEEQAAEKVGDS